MSVTDGSVSITDTNTTAKIPVAGFTIPGAAPNPSAGQSIVQSVAMVDALTGQNAAMIDAIGQLYQVMADYSAKLSDILNYLQQPPWTDQAGRLRAVLEVMASLTLTTVTTVTTVGTVTNQSSAGGFDIKQAQIFALDDMDFQLAVRGRVSP